MEGLAGVLQQWFAKSNADFAARREREQAAEKAAEAEAARIAQAAEAAKHGGILLESLQAAVGSPVPSCMEIDGLDDLNNEELAALDPGNARPMGEGEDAAVEGEQSKLEEWRQVQRGTARKYAEAIGKALAGKKARTCG